MAAPAFASHRPVWGFPPAARLTGFQRRLVTLPQRGAWQGFALRATRAIIVIPPGVSFIYRPPLLAAAALARYFGGSATAEFLSRAERVWRPVRRAACVVPRAGTAGAISGGASGFRHGPRWPWLGFKKLLRARGGAFSCPQRRVSAARGRVRCVRVVSVTDRHVEGDWREVPAHVCTRREGGCGE